MITLFLKQKEDNKHHEIKSSLKAELDNLSPKESLNILYTVKNYFFE